MPFKPPIPYPEPPGRDVVIGLDYFLGDSILGRKVKSVFLTVKSPQSMVIQGALAASSFLVQNLVDVETPYGALMPPSLYLVANAESGERKSSVQTHFFKKLEDLEQEQEQIYKRELEQYQVAMDVWKARKKELLRALTKVDDDLVYDYEATLRTMQAHQELMPKHPAYTGIRTLKDTTPEAAVDIFHRESVQSAILRSSEGEKILAGPAARKLSLWDSLWGGDYIKVDRKTTGSASVNPRLTLYIQAQPDIMQRFVEKKDGNARSIGFFARTLFTYPQTTQGLRIENEQRLEEIGHQKEVPEYDQRIEELFKLNLEANQNSEFERFKLKMTPDAKARWVVLFNDIERSIAPGGRFENAGDHASKLGDNILRLAAVLHCMENGIQGEIDRDTLEEAIRLGFAFSNEFMSYFRTVPQEERDYWALKQWMDQKVLEGRRYIKKSLIRQYGPNQLRNRERIEHILQIMVLNGEIQIGTFGKKIMIDLDPSLMQDNYALNMALMQ